MIHYPIDGLTCASCTKRVGAVVAALAALAPLACLSSRKGALPMIQYTIDTLTCGHCAKRVGAAIAAVAPQANVEIDLPAQRVRIDAADALEPALRAGLTEAGYPPRSGGTTPSV